MIQIFVYKVILNLNKFKSVERPLFAVEGALNKQIAFSGVPLKDSEDQLQENAAKKKY